jgi:hypothetical protein
MSKKSKKNWHWEQDLAALTDALANELLAAPDHEVSACLHEEVGPKARNAVEAVRRLISVADIDSDAPPTANNLVAGWPVHLTRSQ